MRFRIVSVPPLPPCQVWHLLPAYRLPAERNAAAGSLLPSPATKGSSLISTIAELKQDLCHGLPVLAEFPAKALRLTLDNFELLDNSPIDVIQENDLVWYVPSTSFPYAVTLSRRLPVLSSFRQKPSLKEGEVK
jgi:hypothetical protein